MLGATRPLNLKHKIIQLNSVIFKHILRDLYFGNTLITDSFCLLNCYIIICCIHKSPGL